MILRPHGAGGERKKTKRANYDSYVYEGLVGGLSLDKSNTIKPKLNWAKYYDGKLIEVAAPITAE